MKRQNVISCTITALAALWLVTAPTAQASVVYNLTGWDTTGTGGADGGFPGNWVGGTAPAYTGSLNAMWYADVGVSGAETASSTDARGKGADPAFDLAVGPRAWNDNTSGTQGQGHGSDFGLIHLTSPSTLSITVAADTSLGSTLKSGFSLFQGWDSGSSSVRVQPFQNNADNPLGTTGLDFLGNASTTTPGGSAVQLFTNLPAGTYTLFVGGNYAGGTGAPGKYTVGLTASPVPLPAAAWLFGSALVGIAALRRRGKRALAFTSGTSGHLSEGHAANIGSVLVLAGLLALPNTAASETLLYSIGNSLTMDGLTGLTATTDINNYSLRVGTHVRAGAPLNYTRAYPSDVTAGYGTPYGTWDYALSNFGFDHVLIQPFPGTGFGTHDTLGSDISNIKYWIDLAKSSGLATNTSFYIYEAWPHQSQFVGNYQAYWNQPLSGDSNQPMTFAREYFDSAHLALANHYGGSVGIGVIPIGDVISRMDRDIKAGLFPEISDISQLYRDDVHLGDVGRFVATATIYSVLLKTSPENINLPNWPFASGQGLPALTPGLASRIESVVWDVVSHDPRALAAVPLPAAAWLFGSALVGLGSMVRAGLRKC